MSDLLAKLCAWYAANQLILDALTSPEARAGLGACMREAVLFLLVAGAVILATLGLVFACLVRGCCRRALPAAGPEHGRAGPTECGDG